MTNTASFARIKVCLKVTVICPVNSAIRTKGIAESATYTFIPVPLRGELFFVARLKGLRLAFLKQGALYHFLQKLNTWPQVVLLSRKVHVFLIFIFDRETLNEPFYKNIIDGLNQVIQVVFSLERQDFTSIKITQCITEG